MAPVVWERGDVRHALENRIPFLARTKVPQLPRPAQRRRTARGGEDEVVARGWCGVGGLETLEKVEGGKGWHGVGGAE